MRNETCKCGFYGHPRVAEPCDKFMPDIENDMRDCATCGHRENCHAHQSHPTVTASHSEESK